VISLSGLTTPSNGEKQIMNASRRPALSTFLATLSAAALTACGGGDDPAVSTAPSATSCTPSANSQVGKSARLRTLSHLVSGTATLVDSCTIEITNFSYDGLGLAKVFVYGGLAGNYRQGFQIGPNLRGTAYTGQTLRLTLNAGDIEKLDGISIWCVDANANFGDATF
jgi:Electron transfer DM13